MTSVVSSSLFVTTVLVWLSFSCDENGFVLATRTVLKTGDPVQLFSSQNDSVKEVMVCLENVCCSFVHDMCRAHRSVHMR